MYFRKLKSKENIKCYKKYTIWHILQCSSTIKFTKSVNLTWCLEALYSRSSGSLQLIKARVVWSKKSTVHGILQPSNILALENH